ncbi:type IIL restriction-modification enzyme MmeI [Glutamicibacter protophormiae]|uniref:Site-specific DNA-methyltransferase (adenine-specific) n=1 Tax=Glutamicibacter protophormiae TaxID=37930 RepID=A0ABS4XQE8_GLUPR|nr:type IIL restriction-modification enzyme MmeI [Glutamicibacter protophormiae]MBP2398570.1 hypothetical protein [Glutamicibacter protophormiae]GGM02294.1 hypothetical protein GCM10010038_35470 [Glutamicibacter protophormiae]
MKGSDYIRGKHAELAFVTTNSVSQGEHVSLMFPMIFAQGIEIDFAYTSFKWENNARRNAGVTVAVIGLRNESSEPKYIYTDDLKIVAENINGYLSDGSNVCIAKRTKPISDIPAMSFGSMPNDKGALILTPQEKDQLIEVAPESVQFIRKFLGASEFISGSDRYALWINDQQLHQATAIPEIASRIEEVRESRSLSNRVSTKKLAEVPHRFGEVRYKPTDSIIVPSVSSERREYIPLGYLGPDTVISNLAFGVYDAEPWVFALLTSRMHMTWTRAVGGQLETRLRYSNTIVYNNFPVPSLSNAMKEKLTVAALRVLDVREYHCEKTLAELYDPDLMPQDLRDAHAAVDVLVDSIYSKKSYETDEQRLSDLFALYEQMSAEEAAKAPVKKPRAPKKAAAK